MDWLEVTGVTVEAAVDEACAQLDLSVEQVEYEVVEEPVAGLFGRTRGQARILARKAANGKGGRIATKPVKATKSTKAAAASSPAPTTPAPRSARPSGPGPRSARPRPSASAMAAAASAGEPSRSAPRAPRYDDAPVDVDAVVESGTRFLSGLLKAADLEGRISHRIVDAQTVELAVVGDQLGMLVGPKGATLLATQELLRTFVHHDTGGRSGRLMLDIAGYREKRRAALVTFTKQVVETVLETGERRALEPMSAVDRKVVHDTVGDLRGVVSLSEGEDPDRYVVIRPE
jgi:spoIIIJ-associated protein